jgi:1-acyl-sn-glycerol-3-phosphate acyltransferase
MIPAVKLPDVLRTIRLYTIDMVLLLWGLAFDHQSTSSPAGLARRQSQFSRVLRRLAIDLEVVHAERVPNDGGVIFMWNQESHLDHLVLTVVLPRPFVGLYNNEVARTPVYGEHLRRTGHIHVDRTDKAQWQTAVARAAELARDGGCILISPEGTRSWDGELLPMKPGAFILAAAAGVSIVCVTVIGGHRRMPRGSPWVRRGPIRVVFGEPIEVAGTPPERLADIVASTFRALKQRHEP